jgi:hypothetical protein
VATSGNSSLLAGGAITHSADVDGLLTTRTTGATHLEGTFGSLNAAQSGPLVFATTTIRGSADIQASSGVAQSAPLIVGGALAINATGQNVTLTNPGNDLALLRVSAEHVQVAERSALTLGESRIARDLSIAAGGPMDQNGALTVAGETSISVPGQTLRLDHPGNVFGGLLTIAGGDVAVWARNALRAVLDTANTALDADRLTVSGRLHLSSASGSHLTSATTVELGSLSIVGSGSIDVVANQASMPVVEVSGVSVQDAGGTPAKLSIYGSSISQAPNTLLSTEPGVTLNLFARRASIDLSAGASVGEGANRKSGLNGLIEVYSSPQERLPLAHPDGLTNRLLGPISATTEVDAKQTSNRKTVVAIASDSLRIADNPAPAVDSDTVLLLARDVAGGGGTILTHVAASQLRDGRNIATDPERRDDNAYSILPSIFFIADVGARPASGFPSACRFGGLNAGISVSFGEVIGVPNNSTLQTIAVEPFSQTGAAGDVPVYLRTGGRGAVDPTGLIVRRLVFPSTLPTSSVRQVVVDGRSIDDSSAYQAVQSNVAEILNQVRKEQLESGFSNENVAVQLRKGVIAETRVGPAAVTRFAGVGGVETCAGMTVGEQVVCATAASSSGSGSGTGTGTGSGTGSPE